VSRLGLHCGSRASHGKTFMVLQGLIQSAASNLMFVDFPTILMIDIHFKT